MKANSTSCEYIVNKYKYLVYKLAKRLSYGKALYEDLVQAGFMGLIKASNHFDFTKSNNFISYASVYIISEMKKENQKSNVYKISDYLLKLKSKVDKLEGKSVDEISQILKTNVENILICKNLNQEIISFNEIEEFVESPKISFIELTLSKDELLLYKMKYASGLTQKQISERLNISQVTVSRKLKELKDKIIKEELYK